ncbi:MAG: TonB-dependent receptor, partial [Spirochaetales bacterium]|nr:TonB-dependent receptor [Spirochaetales bacterium]
YEAGVKFVPSWIDAFVTLSVFDVTRRNSSYSMQDNDGTWWMGTHGEVRNQGIELEIKAKPVSGLTLAGGLTLQKQRITENENSDFVGKQPTLIPAVAASFTPYYTFEEGWVKGLSLGGGVRYQGKTYADNENELEIPAYTVLDLGVHYRLAHWNFSLNVTNLLDTVYVVGEENAMNYGEGRSILLRVQTSY